MSTEIGEGHTSEYVDFYNYERIHSSIDYVSPVAAELPPTPQLSPHNQPSTFPRQFQIDAERDGT